MSKRFIDISPMRSDLLKMLEEKFLATEHFNSDTINVSLSLKETVDKVVEDNKLAEPEIFILDKAWLKIQMLVKENSGEVAWHCLVEKHTNNKYLIYDVLVFPQEVTGATADGIDGEYEMWLATLPDEQFDFCSCFSRLFSFCPRPAGRSSCPAGQERDDGRSHICNPDRKR